jgi:hypothetical protein
MGEAVWEDAVEGYSGRNSLAWNLENQLGEQVTSGLYLYVIRTDNGISTGTHRGKVVVIH